MSLFEIILIGIGLSMDAFAVSICKGMLLKRVTIADILKVGLWFGGFQALMPIIGYLFGSCFINYLSFLDHWIAFAILAYIGINMIFGKKDDNVDCDMCVRTMFTLAVATSIDALAVGVSISMLNVPIIEASCEIGLITFLFSAAGICLGKLFGKYVGSKAEVSGGIILFIIGIKILLEHLLS